jgi:MOSC domain-containing protein
MEVRELWRYPVKSCAGERVESTFIAASGLAGDRVVQPTTVRGERVTARRFPGLLGLRGSLAHDGAPLVDGHRWDSDEAAELVRAASLDTVFLEHSLRQARFDVLPVSLVTDGAIDALGVDHRRLRPNVVVSGVAGLAERGWDGLAISLCDAVVGVRQVRGRCVMTTYDPDTQERDRSVLQRIVDEYGGRFALDCYVIREGEMCEGDAVEVAGFWTLDPADLSIQIGDGRPAWIPVYDGKVTPPRGSVIAPATPSG